MSQAEVYVVEPNGDVVFNIGFTNAWAGAFFIWQHLSERYGFYRPSQMDKETGITEFHAGKAMMDEFKRLFSHMPKMSDDDFLLMASTCDGAIVPKELMPRFSASLRVFARDFPGGNQSLLADAVDNLYETDIRGIAFRQTSVSQCSWDIVDNDETGEERPLNIDRDNLTSTGREHWFVEEKAVWEAAWQSLT